MIDNFEQDPYRFLSNFYSSLFYIGEGAFPTVEHYFQSRKSLIKEERENIRTAVSPARAKKLGRIVHLRPDWEERKVNVMRLGLRGKFGQNKYLRELLLETGDEVLIEGNHWHDNFWGDCRCGRRSCQGEGGNMLGTLLMELRRGWR